MLTKSKILDDLDAEWLELIFEARELGLTIEEIHKFLSRNKKNEVSAKQT